MKPIIEVKDVWKVYQIGDVKVEALRNLSIKINKGEFVAIQGPSGSGKSTAMNMVGCLDVPTRGHIYLDGQDISKLRESSLAQIRGKKIGFIFQKFNLINTLTAAENVMLPLTFLDVPEARRREIAEQLMSMVDLSNRLDHKPNELSGGQQQRVAIARAMLKQAPILVLDEATSALDSESEVLIQDALWKLMEGKTTVVIAHRLSTIQKMDRIIVMDKGRIVEQGTHHALLRKNGEYAKLWAHQSGGFIDE